MLEITNETNEVFNQEMLYKIAEFLTPRDIDLVLGDNALLQSLNKEFRHQDKTTDVLSFPFDDMGVIGLDMPLGSVVINMDMAKEVCSNLGHLLEFEVALLFIHGVLHLLGYDHECDNGEHYAKEEEIARYFSLPLTLIGRNQEG